MIYDGGADDWSPEDIQSVLDPVRTVSDALGTCGHDVSRVPVATDLAWLDAIRGADAVFNLCEGIGGISHLEYKVASAIELAGVPYTGGSAWTMTICHRKPLLNAVLEAAGLPIPQWTVPDGRPISADFPLPAIVKPAAEDASVGVDQGSVVETRDALVQRVASVSQHYGEVIVQRYVPGREVVVAFVGEQTLPLSEIDFSAMPDGTWPILSFDAKWTPASLEYPGTQPMCPAPVEPALATRLVEVSKAAWRAVDGRGYGRVDLRVDEDGQPWVIEVNPNPDISTDAGLYNMARANDWSYAELVSRIVDCAFVDDGRKSAMQVSQPAGIGRAEPSTEDRSA